MEAYSCHSLNKSKEAYKCHFNIEKKQEILY